MNKSINTSGSGGTGNEACDVDFCNINNAIIDDRYEILCDILSRLPVKSLTRFKSVCKGWRSIIQQDSCFLNLQLRRSDNTPQDTNSVTLLVSPIYDFSHECEERNVNFFSVEDNLSSYQNGASSSDAPLLACHNRNCNDIILPIDNDVGTMLKPINGLLCFVNKDVGSVLICNPTTGEKTPWIQTTSGKLVDDKKVVWCDCDFGFGFHRLTKEHKVVSVYSIREVEQDIMSEETICEVLTVGSNTWRRMDEGPIYMVVTGVQSVYVNGFIYWIGYSKPIINHLFIVGFDVGREKFSKVILLPNLIGKSGPKLVEVDGHIAILDRESDKVTLWIHSDDGNGDGDKWIQEIIKMPNLLDEDSDLAFEAINGTDMIILKPFRRQHLECLYYYDRKKKKYYTRQVDSTMKPSGQTLPDLGYDVATFSHSLLPVQANK